MIFNSYEKYNLSYNEDYHVAKHHFLAEVTCKLSQSGMLTRGAVVITTAQLHSTKPELRYCAGSNSWRAGVLACSWRAGDSRWWGSLKMVPTGNMAKRLSSVNHTTKTIHHHQSIKSQCSPHIETSQLICTANQLICFYTEATLAFNGLKAHTVGNLQLASTYISKTNDHTSILLWVKYKAPKLHQTCAS